MNILMIKNFDLQQIADSGQCFRMNRLPGTGTAYAVISGGRYAEVSQNGVHLTINCPEGELDFWQHYFDLGTDYERYISSVSCEDEYLQKAAAAGSGIRILYQDTWEMIITFILSQQKTIPKIKEAVEALCRFCGTEKTIGLADGAGMRTFYEFPDASQLSKASLEELRALKLGYRAKYIHRVCSDCAGGDLDLEYLRGMDYEAAMKYLVGFYGIGGKVANCVCLFGLHHVDAFPVDTWIEQILLKYYDSNKYEKLPKSRLYQAMIEEHFGSYKGYCGVMQQYIFYYERMVVNVKPQS